MNSCSYLLLHAEMCHTLTTPDVQVRPTTTNPRLLDTLGSAAHTRVASRPVSANNKYVNQSTHLRLHRTRLLNACTAPPQLCCLTMYTFAHQKRKRLDALQDYSGVEIGVNVTDICISLKAPTGLSYVHRILVQPLSHCASSTDWGSMLRQVHEILHE